MADFGNQLDGATESLDRFLDALDNASIKMGSNAAIEAKIARDALKQAATEKRTAKNTLKLQKEQSKLLGETNKALKGLAGSLKGGIGKAAGGLKAIAGAGLIGGLVTGVKFLLDGMLKIDSAMAGLSKRTGLTRNELAGINKELTKAESSGNLLGANYAEMAAEAGNLVEQFGKASMVNKTLIQDSTHLQKAYGLSAQAAGQLTEALERTNRNGQEFRDSIRDIAGKTGASASLVMRDMGSRAQQIAIQNERSTEAMARMSAAATAAGSSLSNMDLKGAFSDIDNIAEGLGTAGAIMGQEWTQAMGNAEELYELNLRGATGREEIQKRLMKAMDATVKINEKGELIHRRTQKPLAEMEGYMERIAKYTGMTNEDLQLMYRESKKTATQQGEVLSDAEYLDQIYKDQLNNLERVQKIATEVFGRITTAFSRALGLDQEGGLKTKLDEIQTYIEEVFDFPGLEAAADEGGVSGFFEAMKKRFVTMAMDAATALSTALTENPEFMAKIKKMASGLGASIMNGLWDWIKNSSVGRFLAGAAQGAAIGGAMGSVIPGLGTGLGAAGGAIIGGLRALGISEDAQGRVHTSKGAALVGEAGGEVVISRSALRSGIGVGGRAASALAGIGVPGYRTGYVTADTSSITGREGLMGAQGSQSFRAARASAFQQEQLRQQAAMLNYWRNVYDEKMDALVEGAKQEKEKGPPWLAKMFLRYNKEIGQQLKKTGPTMSAAIMAGMTKWSTDQDIAGAVGVAVKAGITAGINDPNSKLNELLKKTGEWQGTLTTGLAAIAQGKSLKGAAKSMLPMGANVLANKLFGQGAGGQAAKYLGMSTAATGKYVNSPTLMMVGEEGRGEVVVPTERIRKGLPINAGVARELGSIGVPGFKDGGIWDDIGSAFSMGQKHQTMSTGGMYGTALGGGKLGGYAMRSGQRFGEMGGFGGMAKAGGAGALMTFGNVFAQTGDWKRAGTAGIGAGLGVGLGMGLGALGVPPPLSGMIGNALGGLATKGLNSVFNLTGGYGKGRRRSLKLIEQHIKSGGKFDHGAPGNLKRAMDQAIGGYEKTPTEANFQKLTESLGTSKYVSSMGIPAPALIALGTGQVSGGAATKMFSSINTSLYGSEGGKYRKALGIPMATGGIVNRPTTALIGERGPEAVVPLGDSEMMQELKKQNKLMVEMIKTQKETAKTEIRMDGRLVSEVVGENFYDVGNGL